MIYEYGFKVTIEITAKDDKEEKELIKEFKRKMHKVFPFGQKIYVSRVIKG